MWYARLTETAHRTLLYFFIANTNQTTDTLISKHSFPISE
jgi:hypothetical protein